MEELIKKALNEYFSDFKEYHLIILILFAVIIFIFQVGQAFWFSSKIEKLKNSLRKSEIKFSRHNEMQIKALSEAFNLLAELQFITESFSMKVSPDFSYKTWTDKYFKLLRHQKLNRYIYLSKMNDKLPKILENFQQMEQILKLKKDLAAKFFINDYGDQEFSVDSSELEELNEKIKKYDKDQIISKVLEDIEDLKKDIESFFKKLE